MIAALMFIQLATQKDPESIMRSFWERMDKAKALHVRVLVPKHKGALATEWESWLEKPSRYRTLGGKLEYRWDGVALTTINHENKTVKVAAMATPPLRYLSEIVHPFFGSRDFTIPKLNEWRRVPRESGDKTGAAVSLGSSEQGREATWLFLDVLNGLPIGSELHTSQVHMYCVVKDFQIDPKDRSAFTWPPLNGYRSLN